MERDLAEKMVSRLDGLTRSLNCLSGIEHMAETFISSSGTTIKLECENVEARHAVHDMLVELANLSSERQNK